MINKNSSQPFENSEENDKLNIENLRIDFEDKNKTNINFEQKTNYLIAVNILIYSLFFSFLYTSNFEIISNLGLVLVFLFTIFLTIDFVLIYSIIGINYYLSAPTKSKFESYETYISNFKFINFINSRTNLKKGICLDYLFKSLGLKIIFIILLILLSF